MKIEDLAVVSVPAQARILSMKHEVALQRSDEGYSVSVPGLPGCWSQGATEEEALAHIAEAIREYLSVAGSGTRDPPA